MSYIGIHIDSTPSSLIDQIEYYNNKGCGYDKSPFKRKGIDGKDYKINYNTTKDIINSILKENADNLKNKSI
jgi:hypothetical protein